MEDTLDESFQNMTKTYSTKELQIIGNTFDMITIISRNYKNKHFIVDKVSPQASST